MPVSNTASGIKAGTVAYFAASTAPTGFLKANGAAISRSTYAALFLAIGTTYGAGDGSTTFNVPDLRGEFIRGFDDGRGADGGRNMGSFQVDAYQGHRHYANPYGYTEFARNGGGPYDTVSSGGSFSVVSFTTTGDGDRPDGNNGTPRTTAETRPRNVALLACIKY